MLTLTNGFQKNVIASLADKSSLFNRFIEFKPPGILFDVNTGIAHVQQLQKIATIIPCYGLSVG